jgi:hypothetical protein
MTISSRVTVNADAADQADFQRPFLDYGATYTPLGVAEPVNVRVEVATGGTSYSLAHLTTVQSLVVHNLGTSNYVTLTWRSAGNGATANAIRIAGGAIAVLTDVNPAVALSFVASVSDVYVQLVALG